MDNKYTKILFEHDKLFKNYNELKETQTRLIEVIGFYERRLKSDPNYDIYTETASKIMEGKPFSAELVGKLLHLKMIDRNYNLY